MLQVSLGLVEGDDGKLLCHVAVAKTGNLRKDKPDPVARLSPSSEFGEDYAIDALLCVEKAVEIVDIGHLLSL